MLRPYFAITPRQLVPWVLRQQGVRADLRLRDRHQNVVVRARRLAADQTRWGVGSIRELAEPDQVLPPLDFTEQLEQPLPENQGIGDRRKRRRDGVGAVAQEVEGYQRRTVLPEHVLGLALDQIHFAETEIGRASCRERV